jgi:transposase
MSAKKPATTPIPVQLSETEFNQFILPQLTMPKRGPKCKLGYYRVFNLILWVLYTGMQWKCLPVPTDREGKAEIHYTTVDKVFAKWADDGSLEYAFIAKYYRMSTLTATASAIRSPSSIVTTLPLTRTMSTATF